VFERTEKFDRCREGVRKNLPEIDRIEDEDLRERLVDAWALALSESDFERLDEIEGSGRPGDPVITVGTQAEHVRSVATTAIGIADGMDEVFGSIGIDRDILIAGALAHDLGKPFAFSPSNQQRWQEDPGRYGFPAVRSPIYGVSVAVRAGLPERIVHIIGAHSFQREGQFVVPSLEASIIQYADKAAWLALECAGLMDPSPVYRTPRVER
jgi:hypothetical protein